MAFLLCVLYACGGGGSNSAGTDAVSSQTPPPNESLPAANGLQVVATIAPSVHQIKDDTLTKIVQPSDGTLIPDPALGLYSGDVVIYNGQGIKLGARVGTAASGAPIFSLDEPRLDELYEDLIVNGELEERPELSAPASASKAQPQAWRLDGFACYRTLSGGYSGRKCEFKFKDSEYKLPSLRGEYEAAIKGSFEKYSFIHNTGSGRVSFVLSGKAALELSVSSGVGTFSDEGKKEVCSSSMETTGRASHGRILLASIPFPLGTSGVSVTFPICVATGAKAAFTGEVLSLAPSVRADVLLGGGPPRLAAPPNTGSVSPPDETMAWNLNPDGTSVAKLKLAAGGELAAELGMEISAVKLIYTGFVNRLVGTVDVDAQFAPSMIGASTLISSIKATPMACASLAFKGRYQLQTFGAVPALSLLGGDTTVSSKLADLELKKLEEKWGLCGQASTKTVVSTELNPSPIDAAIKTRVTVTSAPTLEEIHYDSPPQGKVQILNQTLGSVLCEATLDERGQGACEGFVSEPGTYRLLAHYVGKPPYKVSESDPFDQVVVRTKGMLDMPLSFGRRYPKVDIPYVPPSGAATDLNTIVKAGTADAVRWNDGMVIINPEEKTISVSLDIPSLFLDEPGNFDGFVITGFTRDIVSVRMQPPIGIAASVSHTARSIALNMAGRYDSGAKVVLEVTVAP